MIDFIDRVNKGVDRALQSIVNLSLIFLLIPYLEARYLLAPFVSLEIPNLEWYMYPLALIINFVLFLVAQSILNDIIKVIAFIATACLIAWIVYKLIQG